MLLIFLICRRQGMQRCRSRPLPNPSFACGRSKKCYVPRVASRVDEQVELCRPSNQQPGTRLGTHLNLGGVSATLSQSRADALACSCSWAASVRWCRGPTRRPTRRPTRLPTRRRTWLRDPASSAEARAEAYASPDNPANGHHFMVYAMHRIITPFLLTESCRNLN